MTEEKVEKTLGHTLTGVVVSDKMDKTITVLVRSSAVWQVCHEDQQGPRA